MPAHGHYGSTRGVRWIEDGPGSGHFEMKCNDCAKKGMSQNCYHPLDIEHWNPRSMQRCRACESEKSRRAERARRKRLGETLLARNRAYYAANRDWLLPKQRERQRRAA